MSRAGRRKTGGTRNGLFVWGPHGEQPDTVEDNPLLRDCTWCHAAPRQRCKRLTRGGWTELTEFHDCRKTPTPAEPHAPVQAPSRPVETRTDRS